MFEKVGQCSVIVVGELHRLPTLLLQLLDDLRAVALDQAPAVAGGVPVLHAVAVPALGVDVADVPSRSCMRPGNEVPRVARGDRDRAAAADTTPGSAVAVPHPDVAAEDPVERIARAAHASGRYCGKSSARM